MEAHRAEGVQVAATVHCLARGLFRCHVFRCADNPPTAARILAQHRDAEVGHQGAGAVAIEQDVVGLDVAVHHVLRVGIGQCVRHVAEDRCREVRRESSLPAQPFAEGFAGHIAHREEDELTDLFDRVNRHDVRVGQARRHARLAEETFASLGLGGLLGRQELERHRPVELDIARQEDDPHAATAELALERVASGDGRLQGDEEGIRGRHRRPLRAGREVGVAARREWQRQDEARPGTRLLD